MNAGEFDPLAALADLAEEHGAWLHVDGAFGLFARLSPRSAPLAAGVERAHSVIADGHKWLNVPYDCGFAFVRDLDLLAKVFSLTAAYLPAGGAGADLRLPDARELAAGALARRVGGAPCVGTVRLPGDGRAPPRPGAAPRRPRRRGRRISSGWPTSRSTSSASATARPAFRSEELDALNARLGEDVLADGRVYVGTTSFGGKVAFRPAIVNWRTRESDIDLFVAVVRELGARLLSRTK